MKYQPYALTVCHQVIFFLSILFQCHKTIRSLWIWLDRLLNLTFIIYFVIELKLNSALSSLRLWLESYALLPLAKLNRLHPD